MDNNVEFNKKIKRAERTAYAAIFFTFLASILLLIIIFYPDLGLEKNNTQTLVEIVEDEDKIENGTHVRTGLKDADGLMTVVNNCTNCHSAKLITQNRMTKERWNTTIKWMQQTQGLWELGENQKIIVDYLVKNYPPVKKGRRILLSNIEWYELAE